MAKGKNVSALTTHTRVFCPSIQKLRVAVVLSGMKLHDGSLTREVSLAVEDRAVLLLKMVRERGANEFPSHAATCEPLEGSVEGEGQ